MPYGVSSTTRLNIPSCSSTTTEKLKSSARRLPNVLPRRARNALVIPRSTPSDQSNGGTELAEVCRKGTNDIETTCFRRTNAYMYIEPQYYD